MNNRSKINQNTFRASGNALPQAINNKSSYSEESTSFCLVTYLHPEILRYIFTFVGIDENRLIGVSKTFHNLYTEEYPKKLIFFHEARRYWEDKFHNLPCYWAYDSPYTIMEHKRDTIKVMMMHAIFNENIEVAEWVFQFMKELLPAMKMDDYWVTSLMEFSFGIASNTNQVNVIQSIVIDKWKQDVSFCRRAVQSENLQLVKNLLDVGFLAPKNICVAAARQGNIKMLKYLHQRGRKLTRHAMDAAIRNNHVDCIQYCTEQGVKSTPRTQWLQLHQVIIQNAENID